MNDLPMADSVPHGIDGEKVASLARRKFEGALANNAKQNELISFMRELDGWRASGKLAEIGFEFESSGGVVRIWGCAPRSNEDFPPGT